MLEILGYTASALIAVSLLMRSIVRLRWINLAGAVCFTVYGLLIHAYPVALMNLAIVGINLWFLVRMRRVHETFELIRLPMDAPYLAHFMRFYGEDIARHQPDFTYDAASDGRVLMVLRDLVPAGVLIVDRPVEGVGRVRLDFATPQYRDLRVGTYVFGARRPDLLALGYETLESSAGTEPHRKYLERMGFRPLDGRYRLELASAPLR